jgi:hypothetical protein
MVFSGRGLVAFRVIRYQTSPWSLRHRSPGSSSDFERFASRRLLM